MKTTIPLIVQKKGNTIISLSIPADVLKALDAMVTQAGTDRSKFVTALVRREVAEREYVGA